MEKLSKKHLKVIERYKKETELPCYSLIPIEGKPSETDSKMGGFPYLPKGASVPKDKSGKPMVLFIQLNLEGLEPLEDYPVDFPTKGILQVFMAENSEEYPTPHKVVYYDSVGEYEPDDGFADENEWVTSPFKLKAEKAVSVLPVRFMTLGDMMLSSLYNKMDIYRDIIADEINKCVPAATFAGHADTTQSSGFEYMENAVLFKINSELDGRICIGDCGILVAGIPFDALEELDFDRAFVEWDCC